MHFEEVFLFLKDLGVDCWVGAVFFFVDFHFCCDEALEGKVVGAQVCGEVLADVLAQVGEAIVQTAIVMQLYISHIGCILLLGDQIDGIRQVYPFHQVELRRVKCILINDWLSRFEEAIILLIDHG